MEARRSYGATEHETNCSCLDQIATVHFFNSCRYTFFVSASAVNEQAVSIMTALNMTKLCTVNVSSPSQNSRFVRQLAKSGI